MSTNYNDPCTFSNPKLFLIKHIKLDWNVNFEEKKFIGSCVIEFKLNSTQEASANDFIVCKIFY